MPFVLRPYRRVPLPCSITYKVGSLLTLPLAGVLSFWTLIILVPVEPETINQALREGVCGTE